MSREVIEKAIAGDRIAFRDLVGKHQSFAFSLAFRIIGDTGEAEDVTQEAFIRLWKHLPKYRFDVKLTTWLYTIVTNLCMDYLRSRRSKVQKHSASVDRLVDLAEPIAADALIQSEEFKMHIRKTMEILTPKQKAVFVLRDWEGLDVPEVCQILSMSADNVKSNLYYARLKMTEAVNRFYQMPENTVS